MNINTAALKAKISIGIILFMSGILLIYSPLSAEAARNGLILCGRAVIPALFPFFVINGVLMRLGFADDIGKLLGKPMKRLFGLNGSCAIAIITGALCGYPSGAKTVMELYKGGKCTKEEAEILLAYTNNASPAFLIAGVGASMLKSSKTGAILYIIQLSAALAVGMILKPKNNMRNISDACAKSYSINSCDINSSSIRRSNIRRANINSSDISMSNISSSNINSRNMGGAHINSSSIDSSNATDLNTKISKKGYRGIGQKFVNKSRHKLRNGAFKENLSPMYSSSKPTFCMSMLTDSIKDSALSVIPVCGSIIFFSVIVNFILKLGFLTDFVSCLICGIFEVTSAASAASELLDPIRSLAVIAFSVGWSGFSVHIQTGAVTLGELDMSKYYKGKALSCIFCVASTFLLIRVGIF